MTDACGCAHEHGDAATSVEPAPLWRVTEIRLAVIAGGILACGYVLGWVGAPEAAALTAKALALVVAGWTFVPETVRRLAGGQIGVGTLMTIAAAGAVVLGEVGEAAMLAVLFAIAEGLEGYSVARAHRGLRALLDLVPARTTVLRGGEELIVEPSAVQVGDVMVVRPGDRLATDGVIVVGHTSVDTSAITGESMPVDAGPGSEVFAGTINGTGVLQVEATSTTEDNSLARIVAIVEAEQSRKGAGQRLADRVARPLVPGVLIAAVVVAALGALLGDPQLWVHRALVVLVAAAPCALALSVPVTVVAAVGAAARSGVLIKGGAALEALGSVATVAVDKTGTMTRNEPAVVDVVPAPGVSRDHVLTVAAALEAGSEHPLARAVLNAAPANADMRTAVDVTAEPGAGLTGRIDGQLAHLGRSGWIDAGPLGEAVTRLQAAGCTTVVVEWAGSVLGVLAVRDELRPMAADVVADLRGSGRRVAMLTGDNLTTSTALARAAGIDPDAVHAQLRPADKARHIRELRAHGPVAMVGDGVNDAPALAAADVGIAMGAMGADVAIETADVALMGEDLRHVPRALEHARWARTIMWQNVGLSLAIIAVLLPLALFGVLGLAAVVLVHELAEVLVIANGMRAARTDRLMITTDSKEPLRKDTFKG